MMKTILLALLTLFTFTSGTIQDRTEEVSLDLQGIWRNMDGEYVQITFNSYGKATFMRMDGHTLKAKGFIENSQNSILTVNREYPVNETYKSTYVLAPSGKVLVVQKPHSDQAWLFERVSY